MQFANPGAGSRFGRATLCRVESIWQVETRTRLDGVSRYRLPSTAAHGCHELRLIYLGNAMSARSFAKYWLPVVAWMLLIFVMSGDLMSAEHTSRFFVPFLRWIAPDISAETIASLQFVVRKAAHLTEYAILALLLCRALFRGTNLHWTKPALFATTWIACALAAAGDEFHQAHIASRTGSTGDVLIDCFGAAIGIALFVLAAFPKSGVRNPK